MRRQAPAQVPDDVPFALVEKGAHGLRIQAANTAALAAGVAVGAALPDARAALPTLAVRPAEPERDREALVALASWLGRYGPTRNMDGVDRAWIDVTGVPHLFGGEVALCADLARRLSHLGFTARIGLADTLGAAHALARCGPSGSSPHWTIAPPGGTKAALADLPVAALRLAPEDVRLLVRLGLKRIGQLYGLPRATLAARFRQAGKSQLRQNYVGQDHAGRDQAGRGTLSRTSAGTAAAELLLRLDQALGLVAEPRRPLLPPPETLSRLTFPEPLLTSDGVAGALDRLAILLAARLSDQSLAARRFRLALYRTDGTVAMASIGTRAPCRDPVHIRRLMGERLDALDAGFGIDVATLEAGHLGPLEAHQIGFDAATSGTTGDPGALIDRLTSRLGRSRVLVPVLIDSHAPERREAWRPALDGGGEAAAGPGRSSRTGGTHGIGSPQRDRGSFDPDEGGIARPAGVPIRPALLLSPPEPIAVLAGIPDGAPQRFVWRRLARRIVRSEGPERIAPEWWRHIGSASQAPETRDYYRLEEVTGARYWVFREGLYGEDAAQRGEDVLREDDAGDAAERGASALPRWFVHGLFA